jgi:hypothetical protein
MTEPTSAQDLFKGRHFDQEIIITAPRTGAILQIPEQPIEQDHRRIKQRVRPILGFKRFETAAVMIRGFELAEKIKKHQFNQNPKTNVKPIPSRAVSAGDLSRIACCLA